MSSLVDTISASVDAAREDKRNMAARKIQTQYRRKTTRASIGKLRRVPAEPSPSCIEQLITTANANARRAIESMAELESLQLLGERRMLFDRPVVVFRGSSVGSQEGDLCLEPDRQHGFVHHLANAIQYSLALRCLIVVSGDFSGERMVTIMKAVRVSKSLRVLAIGKVHVDSSTKKELENGPETAASSLEPQETRSSPMTALSRATRTANFLLEALYLEDNALLVDLREGARVAEMVGDFFFARYGRLKTLVIARMRFSDASAELLAAALAINTVLEHLDLHGNRLGDASAEAFATRGLPFNKSLQYLNLAENVVTSAGAAALFHCLETANHTLKTLVLTNNNVRNDAVRSLWTAWQANAEVETVELRGNLVHADHLRDLDAASHERSAVTVANSARTELRLFLARKRFGFGSSTSSGPSSPLKPPTPTSSEQRRRRRAKERVAVSPHKWLQGAKAEANAPVSPLRSPVAVYKPDASAEQSPWRQSGQLKLKQSGKLRQDRTKLPELGSRNTW